MVFRSIKIISLLLFPWSSRQIRDRRERMKPTMREKMKVEVRVGASVVLYTALHINPRPRSEIRHVIVWQHLFEFREVQDERA
jgi:hypothetical protein